MIREVAPQKNNASKKDASINIFVWPSCASGIWNFAFFDVISCPSVKPVSVGRWYEWEGRKPRWREEQQSKDEQKVPMPNTCPIWGGAGKSLDKLKLGVSWTNSTQIYCALAYIFI